LINTHCGYANETSDSRLPSVDETPCDDPAVWWHFRQYPSQPGGEGRYNIVVIYTARSGVPSQSGYAEWAPTDFPLVLVGASNETVYKGPSDFLIPLIEAFAK
jgi:hypothetical protein